MAAEQGSSKPDVSKKSATKNIFSNQWRTIATRYLNPYQWSLRIRFLYFTGGLLLLGTFFQVLFLSYSIESTIDDSVTERLQLSSERLANTVEVTKKLLLSQAIAVASMPEVQTRLVQEDGAGLRTFLKQYTDAQRLQLNLASLRYALFSSEGRLLFDTSNLLHPEQDASKNPMVAALLQRRGSVVGLQIDAEGPVLGVFVPVVYGVDFAGGVFVTLRFSRILQNLELSQSGATLVLQAGLEKSLRNALGLERAGDWLVLNSAGTVPGAIVTKALAAGTSNGRVEDVFYKLVAYRTFSGAPDLAVLLTYDSTMAHEMKRNRMYQLMALFFSGALFLWLLLYYNIRRVELFLARLKRIIIGSHSSDFSERFPSDHVHCLELMHCRNEECPVYKDPSLVCYLETGSEAISPLWRDTCIFLNTYETCQRCPVYAVRKGDELTEMGNVINTMMRLWSQFLGRTGHLLAYVLRSQENKATMLPSLDQVSNRLEQMAKLTFFGHDLQGTLDKEEVFEQLAYVFSTQFGLSKFVLFEVDEESNRIVIALDYAQDEKLCKKNVLLSTEICRAHRVAEDVVSFYNPMLCPYFNCDTNSFVRCCLPMVMGGQVGAVFSFVAPKRTWETLRSQQLPVLRKYLDASAPVLSSLRLLRLSKEQSLRDPLTHCHNRRFLDEFLSKYEPLSEREGKKAGFLMADLDYFKQVNDAYGHEAGDAVLQQIVTTINESIRRSDLLIRYGGEEFLILLQDIQNGMAEQVAEKIRAAVEQQEFDLPGGSKIKKTISLGVSEYPEDGNTLYKAIKFSDVALYEAKNQGRNKVVRFKPEMWQSIEY